MMVKPMTFPTVKFKILGTESIIDVKIIIALKELQREVENVNDDQAQCL